MFCCQAALIKKGNGGIHQSVRAFPCQFSCVHVLESFVYFMHTHQVTDSAACQGIKLATTNPALLSRGLAGSCRCRKAIKLSVSKSP